MLVSSSFRALVTAAVTVLAPLPARADWDLNMPQSVTDVGRDIYDLHMLILWICVVIAVVVFGAMIFCLVKYRKSQGAEPGGVEHSTTAEIIWTIIPVIILVAMALPATRTLIALEDTRESKLSIKVTGYQWKWHYDYIDDGVSFFSSLSRESNEARQLGSGRNPYDVENYLLDVDRRLVVPVDTKVRLLITSNDVIHAWWVPDLAVKKDAVPGYINEAWFEANEIGVYRGQCSELCGKDHGFMPIVVDVLSAEDYEAWLTSGGHAG